MGSLGNLGSEDAGGLEVCLREKVNVLSAQKARIVQQMNILWVQKFQSVTSVLIECGAASKNEHSFLTEMPRYLNLGSSAKESVLSDKHGGAHREK